MNPPVLLAYRLRRAASRPVLVPANAYRMPLGMPGGSAADYARAAAAEAAAFADTARLAGCPDDDDARRVLLDHERHFAFLAALAVQAREAVHDELRLHVEVRASYMGVLPAALLAPWVLLGADLYHEAARDAARGWPTLWIGDRIRRDVDFAGDNTLRCALWQADLAAPLDALLRRAWPAHAIRIEALPAPLASDFPIPDPADPGAHPAAKETT